MNASPQRQPCATHTLGKSGRPCKSLPRNFLIKICMTHCQIFNNTILPFVIEVLFFFPPRLAEKKAESLHRLSGSMDGIESSGSYKSLDHIWRPTRLGKQMRGRHTRQTPLMSVSLISVGQCQSHLKVKCPKPVPYISLFSTT